MRIFLFLAFLLLALSSCSTNRYMAHPEPPSGTSHAVASWYGKDFHGKQTSSGEIYNMYSNTCAHKEYPFGTRLKVTHTTNNKSAICVVNDRGPFIEGRDIDLSYAVARDIELIGPGVSTVLLEVMGRDNRYIRRINVQADERTGPFAIQVGSFTEGVNAVRLKAGLDLKYNNSYIQETEINGERYFRVRIGDYEDLQSAIEIAEELGQVGYQTIIMKAEVKI